MEDNEARITINDLPISFVVKYLGWEPARGLWGMKNTRKPIDNLVLRAKSLSADEILPRVQIIVDKNGLVYRDITNRSSSSKTVVFGVNEISYGVQDIVYSRVFSVIIVTDKKLDEDSFLMGKNTVQAKQRFEKYYGNSAPSETTMKRWFADFRRGCKDTDDAERSGRPNEAVKSEKTTKSF